MTLIVTAFMLFSMFFGAGNLIFPAMLGVEAGTSFTPAILGFLATSVVLPVLATIAIAISGRNVRDLANRGGVVFGLVFSILAYLSIGAFYALPRTGAVSYSTAIQPLTGWNSLATSALFNAVFFGVALALAYKPGKIVDNLGKYLTPVLLILLVVLVALSLSTFHGEEMAPADKYAASPATTGLLEGYLTMDSIAALAFGIVVISSLRYKGVREGTPLVRGTIIAGLGAGALLGAIYIGLGLIGHHIPDPTSYADGAGLLSSAAQLTMGTPGQVLFGAIVLLACMTTAVGLIAATSEFFEYLLPSISYRMWAVIFALMSFAMATMGLETVLSVAAPIITFIYPPAITLILLTLVEPLARRRVHLVRTFLIAIWVAVVCSALTTLADLGLTAVSPLVDWAPLAEQGLAWVLPTVAGAVIGAILDVAKPRRASWVEESPVAAE
ncbi:branched-chain amino acid transport system II carrier protein [Corynebacterium sp. zg-331]|nr:branched-chain amino acid transport system II carrier protein [Corynebacterium sp. zg-331]MPV51602.1 branched-chain amino acid transport system II carrier protein [Corynebacterium sp. zg331]